MFIDKVPQLPYEEVTSISYEDDPAGYDQALSNLASKFEYCLVKNYFLEKSSHLALIKSIPKHHTTECVIWNYSGQWLAKFFPQGWTNDDGYIIVDIPTPQITWRKNPDIDFSMTFFDNPMGSFEPDPWDYPYTMTWYMDSAFNPTSDKIWVMTCEVLGQEIKGTKDMGFLTPQVDLEFNPDLPDFNLDLEQIMPAYWDLCYECAYYLDPNFCSNENEKIWVVKVTPKYRKTKEWKWLGEISPEPKVIYNPELPIVKYDIDFSDFILDDLKYECLYNLDRKHLNSDSDDIWAIKLSFSKHTDGVKIKGYISPSVNLETNPALDHLDINYEFLENYEFKIADFGKILIWYTDPKTTDNEKIYLVKAKLISTAKKEITVSLIDLKLDQQFDVFFLTYGEPNCEENWQRLISKHPTARRLDNIDGLLAAHRTAAEQSRTSMFWVVDGDAYISDDWDFNFIPSIYDRDCTFIFKSINPVNGLVYGHSGVKLFPKSVFAKDIEYLDLSTAINPKLKIKDKISNINAFNVDEFHSWKTSFRETIKLLVNIDTGQDVSENKKRLKQWRKVDPKSAFASFVVKGSVDAEKYYRSVEHIDYLKSINNWQFLKQQFKESNE